MHASGLGHLGLWTSRQSDESYVPSLQKTCILIMGSLENLKFRGIETSTFFFSVHARLVLTLSFLFLNDT